MRKIKAVLLFLSDIAVFYFALFFTLFIRQWPHYKASYFYEHLFPFSIILFFTIITFYVIGIYDLKNLKNNLNFFKLILGGILFTFIFSLAIFYLFPFFGITPRFNLFLFILIYALLELILRYTFNAIFIKRRGINVFFVGLSKEIEEMEKFLSQSPQLGYKVQGRGEIIPDEKFILGNKIDLIVLENKKISSSALKYFNLNLNIISFKKFYENIFNKIPLEELEESWFFENIINKRPLYHAFKNVFERLTALFAFIILFPLQVIIALFIKITSEGPIIYKQNRVGKNGKIFTLYKFRTMIKDAEKYGLKKDNTEDNRITPLGKILRATHLDELPQLINIIKGDISFVGPRPERPEFVEEFKKEIPFYEIRHIVKPGLTGWAQINYHHGLTKEDAYQKLQYDLFYLKNRSLILDILIMIKTIRSFFVNPK